jgi:hypothetical protein
MTSQKSNANQDPFICSIFEILSAHITETIYHHIYHSADAQRGRTSLTDEYVRHVQAYVIGIKNDERCYGDVVQGIHKYFTINTRYTTLSFADFVDMVVKVCVPEDYFRQFTTQDKDELLSSIVCDLISSLATYATTPDMLHRTIDGRITGSPVTIRMLQDAGVNALFSKRASIFNSFLKKMGQAREHVSLAAVDDMKRALRRLVKEKAEAVARAEDAEGEVDELRDRLKKIKAREAKLVKLVELLKAGRDVGPEDAGAALAIPKRETIAEPENVRYDREGGRHARGAVPHRETIAETSPEGPRGADKKTNSGAKPPRGEATAGGIPVNFFKVAGGASPASQPPVRRGGTQGTRNAPHSRPAPEPPAHAKFVNLLDEEIMTDAESDNARSGDADINDILEEYL